jgi:hypothetical protein
MDKEGLFYDEEDVLPLELFIAELDLLTSGMLKKSADPKNDRSNGKQKESNAKVKGENSRSIISLLSLLAHLLDF